MTTYVTGDRRSRISVSTTLSIVSGLITNWVNGSYAENGSGGFFPAALANNTGKIIRFDLSTPGAWKRIRAKQGGNLTVHNVTRGNWQAYGVNGSTRTAIGSPFTLGGAAEQTIDAMAANETEYEAYEFEGVGGAVSDSGWMLEIEIEEEVGGIYCNPRPDPWPVLTNVRKDIFTKTIPSKILTPEYSGPSGYTPPYTLIDRVLLEDCEAGDIITAFWHQGFTVPGPQIMECSGVLLLEKDTDTANPISIPSAGPTTDFRCLCENRGTNITQEIHHGLVMWGGMTLVMEPGDYYVSARAYASPGDFLTPIGMIDIWDGDLVVWRERSQA